MSDTLFIKFDDYVKVDHANVTIGDVCKLHTTNQSLKNKIKNISLINMSNHLHKNYARVVFSSLKIIELILSEYPNITISPIGSDDFLIAYDTKPPISNTLKFIKISIICLILFFGAAFTIIAFNTDITINLVFNNIYEKFTGSMSDNHTGLELGYCIGIPLGILVFYNHLGKKKITSDPTPIEIEMRLYENDINTTLINGVKREDCHIDVN